MSKRKDLEASKRRQAARWALGRDMKKIRKVLLRDIAQTIKKAGLEFYGCGYVDHTEPDRKMRIAKLPRKFRFKPPVFEALVGYDHEEKVDLEWLSRDGYMADSVGHGAVFTAWADLSLENLLKFANVLGRWLPCDKRTTYK